MTRAEIAKPRGFKPDPDMRRGDLVVVPMTVKAAKALVKQWHRKLEDVQGGLFAAGVVHKSKAVGVGIAGNPARVWQGTGRIVISRIATDESKNACSMLYGALCRAAKALGYREAWTYTVDGESGESLKAAGFTCLGMTKDGEHSRKKRPRKPAKLKQRKYRWWRLL